MSANLGKSYSREIKGKQMTKLTLEQLFYADLFVGMTNYHFMVFQIPLTKNNYETVMNSSDEEIGKMVKRKFIESLEKAEKSND